VYGARIIRLSVLRPVEPVKFASISAQQRRFYAVMSPSLTRVHAGIYEWASIMSAPNDYVCSTYAVYILLKCINRCTPRYVRVQYDANKCFPIADFLLKLSKTNRTNRQYCGALCRGIHGQPAETNGFI